MTPKSKTLYGLMAEFDRDDVLVDSTRRVYEMGYRRFDAYAPFPVHGLAEAMGRRRTWVPAITLLGGLTGGLGAFFMMWYSACVDYPINVGGRPFYSWPAFIPITFELTVLGASLASVFGMLIMNALPQPYHPVFNVRSFALASRSRFFICIECTDDKFDLASTRQDLETLKPLAVHEVPK